MQDDPFPAAERILADIETVFKKDPELREFDIIPVTLNQNKSPVHHEEHCLGLESWCVRHVYCYAYHRLMDARQQKHRRTDPSAISRMLLGALLLNPDVQTFWNMRRELVEAGYLDASSELHFTVVVLSKKPKSAEVFTHRKWLLRTLLKNAALHPNQRARIT
ncbi:protein prenyltransferase alpha subunit repeat-containing protein 1 isoform X3 [Anabrus simplex]|uniref:protein prenyltransferase alpha subunit repeat-containing protein 1 isoform X3 n=1 Tax=Anabrus simplex TaxID=316456 RepID=UPI0035A39BA4